MAQMTLVDGLRQVSEAIWLIRDHELSHFIGNSYLPSNILSDGIGV